MYIEYKFILQYFFFLKSTMNFINFNFEAMILGGCQVSVDFLGGEGVSGLVRLLYILYSDWLIQHIIYIIYI